MRIRQRIRLRRFPLAFVGRALLVLLALGLCWYGAMLVLLALKVSPESVNAISGYRSAYDFLAGLEPHDMTTRVRLIAGLAGLAAFLVFGYLALREVPRPYLARSPVALRDDDRGSVEIEPRAVERVAEVAAYEDPAVMSATARLADRELHLELALTRAGGTADSLRRAQRRAREALGRHQLPVSRVNVNLARFERRTRRELA